MPAPAMLTAARPRGAARALARCLTRRRASLRQRLALTIAIVLLPAAVLVLYLGVELYRYQVHSVDRDLRRALAAFNASQQDSVAHATRLLAALAALPAIAGQRDGYCAQLRAIAGAGPAYRAIGLSEPNGRVVCSDRPLLEGRDTGRQDWFRRALASATPASSGYYPGMLSERPVRLVSQPLAARPGQAGAVLFVVLDVPAALAAALRQHDLPASTVVALFRPGGGGIATAIGRDHWEPLSAAEMDALAQADTIGTVWPGTPRRRWAVAPLGGPRHGGASISHLAVSAAFTPFAVLHRQLSLLAAGGAAVGGVLLYLMWLGYRRFILRQTDRLVDQARRIGAGEWQARSGIAHDSGEFGLLAQALDTMSEQVQKRETDIEWHRFALDQHAIVSVADVDGRISFVNDRFCDISGYRRAELLGRDHRMLNSGLHPPEFFHQMWQTLDQGRVWHGVIRNLRKGGGYYWVTSTIVPRLDQRGRPIQYLSIRTDITASLQMKHELRHSEALYRLLAENTQDVVALHANDGRLLYLSPSSARVFGYDSATLQARGLRTLLPRAELAVLRRQLLAPLRAGARHASAVLRMRHRAGHLLWVELLATAVPGPDGAVNQVQSTLRDISERQLAGKRLRLHEMAVRAGQTGIVLIDAGAGHPVVYINPAFSSISGHDESVLGCHVLSLLPGQEHGFGAALRKALPAFAQLRFTRRDGTARWADCALAPLRDEAGHCSHFVLALHDMTEKKLVLEQMQQARDAAEQANRAKSDFLSRMTHELRTPLNFILGFAQLLEAQPGALDELQRDGVRRIVASGWHLRTLIDDVLDLSRIEAGRLRIRLQDLDFQPLLGEAAGVLALLAERHGVTLALPAPEPLWLHADYTRLKQVMLNLLSNAIKFNRPGGRVGVSWRRLGDGRVRIEVRDDGPGIAAARQHELFQPFSRLDADHQGIAGTGIGLSISHSIVLLMAGRIGVDSAPGSGSTFWIDLPAAGTASTAGPPSHFYPTDRNHHENQC